VSAVPEHVTDAVLVNPSDYQRRRADLAVAGFLARYRIQHTRYVYGISLRQWFSFCDEHFVDPLHAERSHIEIWARLLEERGNKLSTVAGKLNALAGFYRYAFADGLIDKDPMAFVRRPQIKRASTTDSLSRTELWDCLAAAEASCPQDFAAICLLGYNGLRVSEVCGIDIEDFGRHKGQPTITVLRKGGETQEIPLSYRTAYAVDLAAGDRTSGPLFVSREGNRLDRKGIDRICKRIAASVGITKRVHPHCYRTTFVTLSRNAGASDRDIMAATNHADERMLSYYDKDARKIERSSCAVNVLAAFVERAG
jgi:site-specific recombinase XerD